MPRTTRSLFLLPAVAALALTGACSTTVAGTPSADPVAVEAGGGADAVAWVDQVCQSLLPFVRASGDAPVPSESPDPASLVRAISTYLGNAEDAAGSAIDGMEAAGPAPVAGGDEVVERLSGSLETFQASFRDARTRVERVDVTDRQALLTELPAAVASLQELAALPNPMADFEGSPELDRAGREAPGCQQISREFGR